MSYKGTLYIVSAPSGAGKTSLLRTITEELTNLKISVSHTTRAMRPGEENGVHYHFVSVEQFKERIATNEFLEYAEVFGNWYGTSIASIDEQLNAGHDVVLEIDWQGAQQVRERLANTISIFILPPSRAELEHRLNHRGQDDAEVIAERMSEAISEISHYDEYDYVIVNDDFNTAKNELSSIFIATRQRLSKQQHKYQTLIDDLT
ncbi:MAG: guanylate kinase [Gammaproteobacteria bacterium]|nr:guanylate kinase [Gammaproteobacteria bacterium]NNJ73190.1 guanylate kinase [Enterobacterales bacterium]